MDLFRRNQKWIFIIVSIIIIPSFALVWGVGGFQAGRDFEIAKIGRESLSYRDYERFRLRMRAAMGEMPFYFGGAPDNAASGDLWAHVWAYALIKDADAAGVRASDAMIGTYLQNQHPVTAAAYRSDPASMDGEVDKICRRLQISRAEFLLGVRELMALTGYVAVDNNTVVVGDDSAYKRYAFDRAQAMFKRIRAPETEAMSRAAKDEFAGKDKEELQTLARDRILSLPDDPRFREPAKWNFEYTLIPFAAETSLRVFGEDELRAFYEQNRARFGNRPLADIRDQALAALSAAERERQALRNLTVDVDPQLRANGELSPGELEKLTPLAKYGVRAGVVGAAAATATELAANPLFGPDSEIAARLSEIDGESAALRDPMIEAWKSGYNLAEKPIRGADGFIRLKLLEYAPSGPIDVDDPDGMVRADLYAAALSDLIGARVEDLALEEAENVVAKVREHIEKTAAGEVPDGDFSAAYRAIAEESLPYNQIMAGADAAFGRLAVGEVYGPLAYADAAGGEKGWELRVLTGRAIPSREEFDAEPSTIRGGYQGMLRMDRSGDSGLINSFVGPVFRVQPTTAMFLNFWDRVGRGDISVNPDLIGS
ncbi:MAG: SurA N-terminal domain-containing protein [Planctomycetota bacterium]|jgi:hypothetical protein|nr:SurA N-terminal domain-containing protein [Planctomycetota bacterium]